jgi:hypothetical protein
MARGIGQEGILSWNNAATTFGTATASGAGHGIYARNFKVNGGVEPLADMSITGGFNQRISSPGARKATFSFEANYSYQGFERVLANLFGGISGAPTTVDTSAYQHRYRFARRDTVIGTLAYEGIKDTTVVECPACWVTKVTLSSKEKEDVMINVEGIADDVTISSAVNTTTTIDNVTVLNYQRALFSESLFKLNDQTAGSLAAAPIYVAGWEVTIERGAAENITTERGNKSSLFRPTGFVQGKLKVTYGMLQNGTGGNLVLLTDHLANTAKKAKVELTSSVLAGAATQYFQAFVWMPNLRSLPSDIIPVQGPDGISWDQEYEFSLTSTAPTGFTAGDVDGCVIDVYSQLNANPFTT